MGVQAANVVVWLFSVSRGSTGSVAALAAISNPVGSPSCSGTALAELLPQAKGESVWMCRKGIWSLSLLKCPVIGAQINKCPETGVWGMGEVLPCALLR